MDAEEKALQMLTEIVEALKSSADSVARMARSMEEIADQTRKQAEAQRDTQRDLRDLALTISQRS